MLSSVDLVQGTNQLQFDIPFGAQSGSADVRITVSTPDPDSSTFNSQVVLNAWHAAVNPGIERTIRRTSGASGMVTADFNNDGDIDVFAASITGGTTEYYDNLGDGFFTTTEVAADFSNSLNELEVADVNNDGLLDVVAGVSGSSNTVDIFIQQPAGVFSLVSLPSLDSSKFVEVADFNGDGFLDIITAEEHVNILINDGDGTFTASSVDTENHFFSELAVGDVDADGDIDAVAIHSADVILYRNDGNGNLATINGFATASTGRMAHIDVLDLNQDGIMEIVFGHFIDGNIHFFENTGSGYVQRTTSIEGTRHGVEFGDVDGDGDVDILTADIGDGVEIYVNTGDNITYDRITIHDDLSEFVQAADFDGDGDLDFVYEKRSDIVLSLNDTAAYPLRISVDADHAAEASGLLTALVSRPPGASMDADLVVDLASSHPPRERVPAAVTILAGSDSVAFPVTVADDGIVNGDQTVTVTATVNGVLTGTDAFIVTDDDEAGFALSTNEVTVAESGTSDTVSVQLSAEPVGTVVVTVAVSDASEFTIDTQSVQFDSENWNQPQTATVTGVADGAVDGNQVTQLLFSVDESASDSLWHGLAAQVDVTTTDNPLSLDLDGDGAHRPLTDGLLTLRFLAGFTGQPLIANAVDPNAQRTTAGAIETFLNNQIDGLDVDGDGSAKPLSDGVLVLRYLAGFRGAALIANAVDPSATRQTAPEIESRLASGITGSASGPVAAAYQQPADYGFVYHPNDSELDDFFATGIRNERGF